MEYLDGGRLNQIARVGNTIIRPAGKWTPTIHRLLHHVRENGFFGVPEAFGFDKQGNEIVSFIPGDVSNYPLSPSAASREALVTAAQLLRAYHDASASFINQLNGSEVWMLPSLEPTEVICHGDYAPYNVVLTGNRATAIIDFDTAHPAPRVWDIAYALYRWAPLMHPNNPDGLGTIQEKIERAKLFCDAYDLALVNREGVAELVIKRLQALIDLMKNEAKHGNETFQANVADGHHLTYLKDIDYLRVNGEVFQQAISDK